MYDHPNLCCIARKPNSLPANKTKMDPFTVKSNSFKQFIHHINCMNLKVISNNKILTKLCIRIVLIIPRMNRWSMAPLTIPIIMYSLYINKLVNNKTTSLTTSLQIFLAQ
jgi:hypothetical protein